MNFGTANGSVLTLSECKRRGDTQLCFLCRLTSEKATRLTSLSQGTLKAYQGSAYAHSKSPKAEHHGHVETFNALHGIASLRLDSTPLFHPESHSPPLNASSLSKYRYNISNSLLKYKKRSLPCFVLFVMCIDRLCSLFNLAH